MLQRERNFLEEVVRRPKALVHVQVGKDRQRARQTDALAMAQMAFDDEAPGASAPVGSALESGVASGVATATAADDHADDAGTQPAVKAEVRSRSVTCTIFRDISKIIKRYWASASFSELSGGWECSHVTASGLFRGIISTLVLLTPLRRTWLHSCISTKRQKCPLMIEINLFIWCPRVHFRRLHVQSKCNVVIANGECLR